MATNAIIGAGLTLGISTTEGGSYTAVAEVVDINFPELDTEDVDASHYTSPNQIKEYIAGWSEGGEVEVTLNFTSAEHANMLAIRRLARWFKITMPDTGAATFVWPGYVKVVGGAAPNQDKVTTRVVIKVAGAVTFTP